MRNAIVLGPLPGTHSRPFLGGWVKDKERGVNLRRDRSPGPCGDQGSSKLWWLV